MHGAAPRLARMRASLVTAWGNAAARSGSCTHQRAKENLMSRFLNDTIAASIHEFTDAGDDACDLRDLIAVACNETWSQRTCASFDGSCIDFE